MLRQLCVAVACALLITILAPAQKPVSFKAPVRLKAGGAVIAVEAPGYAAPCWQDITGDGKKDLIVGQFKQGLMKLYKNLGDGQLGAGTWITVDGKPASVPGVW